MSVEWQKKYKIPAPPVPVLLSTKEEFEAHGWDWEEHKKVVGEVRLVDEDSSAIVLVNGAYEQHTGYLQQRARRGWQQGTIERARADYARTGAHVLYALFLEGEASGGHALPTDRESKLAVLVWMKSWGWVGMHSEGEKA